VRTHRREVDLALEVISETAAALDGRMLVSGHAENR
jgi:hypothetical protein